MAETASTLDVSPSTAKTHLDNIFSKSGVNRQADLMRFAAQFAPPTSASR
jgi:DNA-binding CsgD family transcriptional regulator